MHFTNILLLLNQMLIHPSSITSSLYSARGRRTEELKCHARREECQHCEIRDWPHAPWKNHSLRWPRDHTPPQPRSKRGRWVKRHRCIRLTGGGDAAVALLESRRTTPSAQHGLSLQTWALLFPGCRGEYSLGRVEG